MLFEHAVYPIACHVCKQRVVLEHVGTGIGIACIVGSNAVGILGSTTQIDARRVFCTGNSILSAGNGYQPLEQSQ